MRATAGTHWRRCAVLAALCLSVPGTAAAQEPEAGEQAPTPAQASDQLEQTAEALSEPSQLDPTDELRHLAAVLPYLEGRERRQAKAILARPPAGEETFNDVGAGWTNGATMNREYFDSPGGQFRIHYVPTGQDAPPAADAGGIMGVPDYVEDVAADADESYSVQNVDLDWPDPKPDGSKGDTGLDPPSPPNTGRTDIYLSDLCCPGGQVLFGYAAPDDASTQCTRPPFRCFAYLVLDNNYAESEYGYGGDPDIPLSVTTAHEYNHILQFRLDTLQDTWMFESTAVWAEEQTFPDADDWISTFLGRWVREPMVPVAKAVSRRIYGSAVWNHWLELGAGYGADVILDAWERSRQTKPKDYAVGAYSRAIKANGGGGFSREFARFATATAEWRVLDGNFPGPDANDPDEGQFPNVRRQGTLRPGRRRSFLLDHTAYRLIRVKPRGHKILHLRMRAPRGVRSGIALVARDGDPLTGTIRTKLSYRRRGRKVNIRLANARRYERITAVVVNADGRVRGFGGVDWLYAHDNERYRVRLR